MCTVYSMILQSTTVGREVPVRHAISTLGSPSAASNTIRAPHRQCGPNQTRLALLPRRERSPLRSTSGAATDMTHYPTPHNVKT
jgi:hypothetical protein